jgi:hypothetical protein
MARKYPRMLAATAVLPLASGCLTLQNRYSLMDLGDRPPTEALSPWPILIAAVAAATLAAVATWAILKWQRRKKEVAPQPEATTVENQGVGSRR